MHDLMGRFLYFSIEPLRHDDANEEKVLSHVDVIDRSRRKRKKGTGKKEK